ncbi:hypothetical protein [Campylobacter concisus]|jgi:hypothetical protein|uniref:hypothetical protein n=1 Tax=Campylobacter concisus TaxID=199 RepID=UPI000CD9F583|nr:hypothetical protein [Campylobacter concisus]
MKDKKLIIKDIQGEIYVISQDGSIKMLKDGDEIYAGEKIFTKNLDAKITLEDGEQVNLSAHQSINLDEILKISAKEADEQSDHSNGFGASEGISLSAASFVTSGHSANIHQIYNQHRSLEPNISSAQPSELKSVSGASSTLIEKSSAAAEPKEEPFIDTINVLNVTNRGLDADIWLYDSARNHGRGLDYYDIEHNSKSILKEWSASHHVSATSTFNDLYYYSGQQADPGYFDTSDPAKASRLRDRTPTAMELAKIGRASNADYANDRLSENMTSPFKPHNLNGHYKLYESKITADGVMVSMDGWIFIKNRSDINNFYYDAKPERQSIKFEFDGREISWQPFGSASKNGGRDEGNAPQGVSTSSLNLTEDYGFYKVHIEVSDDRYSYNFTAFSGISPTNKIISDDPNIKLVSNAYMEALAQKGLVTKESDTFYKAKETNGVKFGDNASDFDKPFDLEFKGTKDVGSNDDDKFIFNSHDIDAKGGIDTLLFTQNVDLTKIEDLDKRLESFERIELDSTKAVKLKLNGQNIIDMIDSNPTKGPDGLESLNTILKISGDSDDVVQLVGNFVKATNGEVAALNAKNSVIGADDYNKLDEVGGEAVNQVYRGENNAGQTFFVEIDKNVHVEVM